MANTRSYADDDVKRTIVDLLRGHSKVVGDLSSTMIVLERAMRDPEDGPELVRLMQSWGACVDG